MSYMKVKDSLAILSGSLSSLMTSKPVALANKEVDREMEDK